MFVVVHVKKLRGRQKNEDMGQKKYRNFHSKKEKALLSDRSWPQKERMHDSICIIHVSMYV